MQELHLMSLETREKTGGREAGRIRTNGYIPAIVYGKGIENLPVKIKLSDFRIAVQKYGRNAIFAVNLPGREQFPVVVKEIQHDVITGEMTHVDLQKISLTEVRKADVPVVIHGREALEASKLLVIQQVNQITVKCLPQDTPQFVTVDVSGLAHGESITAGQITLPEGVVLDGDPGQVVVVVTEAKETGEEAAGEATGEEAEAGEEGKE